MLVKIEQEGGIKSIKIAEASDGLNAYQLAVKNDGFVGDYDAWKVTLKGEAGYTPIKDVDYFDGTPFVYDDLTQAQKDELKIATSGEVVSGNLNAVSGDKVFNETQPIKNNINIPGTLCLDIAQKTHWNNVILDFWSEDGVDIGYPVYFKYIQNYLIPSSFGRLIQLCTTGDVVIAEWLESNGAGGRKTGTSTVTLAARLTGVKTFKVTINWDNLIDRIPVNVNVDLLLLNTLSGGDYMPYAIKSLRKSVASIAPPLDGMKIVCLGDSVTENGNYPSLLEVKLGATVINSGIGGSRLTYGGSANMTQLSVPALATAISTQDFTSVDAAVEDQKNNFADDNTIPINKLKNTDFNTVDIVTVFAGTNDFDGDWVQLGTKTSTDHTVIRGAVNEITKRIQTAYPHIKVFFITPYHRYFGTTKEKDADLVSNGVPLFLVDYVDAIKEMASLNHIPALDLFRNSGFNKYNHDYFYTDNVHLNSIGQEVLAEKIASFILSNFK